jgi:hypothetical protein
MGLARPNKNASLYFIKGIIVREALHNVVVVDRCRLECFRSTAEVRGGLPQMLEIYQVAQSIARRVV